MSAVSILDQATPLLERLQAAARSQGLVLRGAQAAARLIRHRSVTVTATATGARLTVDDPSLRPTRLIHATTDRLRSALIRPHSAPVSLRTPTRALSTATPRSGEVMYWMNHYADPLPSESALSTAAATAIQSALPGLN